MTKTEKIKNLLDENRNVLLNGDINNGICYDGIVNENIYEKQKFKICFLLRETNGDVNGKLPDKLDDWDYVGWLKEIQAKRKEPLYKTFYNVCMWVEEFYELLDNGKLKKDKYLDDCGQLKLSEKTVENLNKIAICNLKKTWGRGETDDNSIKKYCLKNDIKQILEKQLSIIDPTIVLCGGKNSIIYIAQEVFGNNTAKIKKITSNNGNEIMYFEYGNRIFVDFYHPSPRFISREKCYHYAEDVFGKILEQVKR